MGSRRWQNHSTLSKGHQRHRVIFVSFRSTNCTLKLRKLPLHVGNLRKKKRIIIKYRETTSGAQVAAVARKILSEDRENIQSTMKGNQGLEALAALCGGQSDAPTETGMMVTGSGQSVASVGSTGGNSLSAHQRQTAQDMAHQASQRQTPMTSQQSPLHNLTQQQWQQALAAAAALQNNGVTPSLAQNLLFSGISTQGLGENAYSAMQQYAFGQYVQAQAKLSAAQQTALAQSLSAYSDPSHQALVLALSAGKGQQVQHQVQQARGEFVKPLLCCSIRMRCGQRLLSCCGQQYPVFEKD